MLGGRRLRAGEGHGLAPAGTFPSAVGPAAASPSPPALPALRPGRPRRGHQWQRRREGAAGARS